MAAARITIKIRNRIMVLMHIKVSWCAQFLEAIFLNPHASSVVIIIRTKERINPPAPIEAKNIFSSLSATANSIIINPANPTKEEKKYCFLNRLFIIALNF